MAGLAPTSTERHATVVAALCCPQALSPNLGPGPHVWEASLLGDGCPTPKGKLFKEHIHLVAQVSRGRLAAGINQMDEGVQPENPFGPTHGGTAGFEFSCGVSDLGADVAREGCLGFATEATAPLDSEGDERSVQYRSWVICCEETLHRLHNISGHL